ncbi:MAG: hypothetical protein ABJB40_03310 [Acidobacteriota bacterium]
MAAEKVLKCSKCGGAMVKGFIADKSEHSYHVGKWVEGEPEHPSLLGITGDNVNVYKRPSFDVRSLRCEQCGFLENYAV